MHYKRWVLSNSSLEMRLHLKLGLWSWNISRIPTAKNFLASNLKVGNRKLIAVGKNGLIL